MYRSFSNHCPMYDKMKYLKTPKSAFKKVQGAEDEGWNHSCTLERVKNFVPLKHSAFSHGTSTITCFNINSQRQTQHIFSLTNSEVTHSIPASYTVRTWYVTWVLVLYSFLLRQQQEMPQALQSLCYLSQWEDQRCILQRLRWNEQTTWTPSDVSLWWDTQT